MNEDVEKVFEKFWRAYFDFCQAETDFRELAANGTIPEDFNYWRLVCWYEHAENEVVLFLNKLDEFKRGRVDL